MQRKSKNKIRTNKAGKLGKKLRTSSLSSKFTDSYKKRKSVGFVYSILVLNKTIIIN